MEPAALLVLVAGLAVAWWLAAFLTGALAWVLVAVMALSLAGGVPVPSGVVVLVVALMAVSQIASRSRTGSWRSPVLQRFAR